MASHAVGLCGASRQRDLAARRLLEITPQRPHWPEDGVPAASPARWGGRSEHFLCGTGISERFEDRTKRRGGVIGDSRVAPRGAPVGIPRRKR
jgi:hypothetical protein